MLFTAIIPIKKESERLANKNFLDFNGAPLFHYILLTLEKVDCIDEILIDTDCIDDIKEFCETKISKAKIIKRPTHLLGNNVVMNQLLEYNLKSASNEYVFQTHVTNPLLSEITIKEACDFYLQNLPKYSSLFSVNKYQKRFFYVDGKPINHELTKMLPTQNIQPVYEENSNFFIFSKQSFHNSKNRISDNAYLFEISKLESIDIDYEEEFKLAELIKKHF